MEVYSPYMEKHRAGKKQLFPISRRTALSALCAGFIVATAAYCFSSKKDELQIPPRYRHVYARLETLGTTKEERKLIASIPFSETNHRHYAANGKVIIGKDGDTGLSQMR